MANSGHRFGMVALGVGLLAGAVSCSPTPVSMADEALFETLTEKVGAKTRDAAEMVSPVVLPDDAQTVDSDAPEPAPVKVAPPKPVREPAPLEIRKARTMLSVYAAPSSRSPLRGRIPKSKAFTVMALVDGKGCGGKGWADVGGGGFVCLEHSRPSKTAPRSVAPLRDRGITPFYYGKVPKGKAPAPRWSSLEAYLAGEAPSSTLEQDHDYAFSFRKRAGGHVVLMDKRRRVVREKDLRRFIPSRFRGRDLVAEPVSAGSTLAWTVQWPETIVYPAIPGGALADAPVAASLDYHVTIDVDPTPIARGLSTWYRLADGSGFVPAKSIRRFVAPHPLDEIDDVADDQVWIDVELDQQVLTVMKGSTPLFATLVSTGRKGPTPRGVFRIKQKRVLDAMSSSPGATDSYHVEAVPFVQYFHGSFALHAAYWHNRFGFRQSHGCVNLSPLDAGYVFAMTTPKPRNGWIHLYEQPSDLGTVVRIRDRTRPVEDRRAPVERVPGP